jgi:hypothetical protein
MAWAVGGIPRLVIRRRGLGQIAAQTATGSTLDCSNVATWLAYPNPCWLNLPTTWAGINAAEQAVNAAGPPPSPSPPSITPEQVQALSTGTYSPSTVNAITAAQLTAAQASSAQSTSDYLANVQTQLAQVGTGYDCSQIANVLNPLTDCTWSDWITANGTWVAIAAVGAGLLLVVALKR